jgi:arabinogalactan oligomer/maltooligosaccharide transport system permease protein
MKKLIALLFVLAFSAFSLYPILYILSVSLADKDAFQVQSIFTGVMSPQNYKLLFSQTDFLIWLRNSFLISVAVTTFSVGLASTSGYALSRLQGPSQRWLLMSLITTQMFPATMVLLPFFIILSKLQLLNSFWGLFFIYAATALPFNISQMKGWYDTLPRELEEAAALDGCHPWKTFVKVIFPLSLPALVISGLFSFLMAWSEYAVAAVVLQDPALYTLPLGLKTFQSSLSTQWGLYAAGALVVSIPVLVVFIMISRYLISGLTLGSVKG